MKGLPALVFGELGDPLSKNKLCFVRHPTSPAARTLHARLVMSARLHFGNRLGGAMQTQVSTLVEQIRHLGDEDQQRLLSLLAAVGIALRDDWGEEIARDTAPGGRLELLLDDVSRILAAGRPQPHCSLRIGSRYRALALLEHDAFYGFWIGTQAEHDRLRAGN